uniref:Uncharacterized protein n=1 Tax=Arundo donax TaxID=35708 RepID=A0A0A9D437_ARUDO
MFILAVHFQFVSKIWKEIRTGRQKIPVVTRHLIFKSDVSFSP